MSIRSSRNNIIIFCAAVATAAIGVARAQDRPAVFTQEDRDVDEALAKAQRLEREGDPSGAGQEYAKLEVLLEKKREHDPDARLIARTGLWLDKGVTEVLRARLRALAPEGKKTYRAVVDGRAKAWYDAALDQDDPDALEAVAARSPFSSVAPLALRSLGEVSFERGDLARAERAFTHLELDAANPAEAQKFALKRLCAAVARGDSAAATDALASFEARGGDPKAALIPVAGRVLTPAEAVDEARRSSAGKNLGPVDPGRLAIELALDTPEIPDELAERLERVNGAVPAYQEPVFDPESGFVIVTDERTLRAVDPEGQGRGWKLSVALNRSEPGRLEVATERPAIGGGRVFATFFRNRPAIRVKREVPPNPNGPQPPGPGAKKNAKGVEEEELRRQADWSVVACDARTGRLEWNCASDARFEDFAKDAEWVSAPCYAEGQIFATVLVHKGSDLRAYVVALDAVTGKVRSRAFIASRSPYDFLGLGSPVPAPAFRGGRIYAATSIGVIACLEPSRGDVLWLAHYNSVPERSQPEVVRGERRFRAAPPLVLGNASRSPVVVAPVDAVEVLALDAETGERVWTIPRGDARVIAESPSGAVLLVSDRVLAFDRRTGAARFLGDKLPGRPLASPLVTGSEALVPLETGLARVSLDDGRVLGRYRYQRPSVEAGAVVGAGEGKLLTASYCRANVYEDRARTVALAQGLPAGQAALILGELAAHRGETEDAIRKLSEAAQDSSLARNDRARARKLAFAVLSEEAARARDEGRRGAFLESARLALENVDRVTGIGFDAESTELARRALALRRRFADALAAGTAATELSRAADEYGRILAAPQGTLTPLDSGVEVDARAYARQKLRSMIASKGRACYESQDRSANELLRIATGTGTKEGLERILLLFPASKEVAPALFELHKYDVKNGLESEAAAYLEQLVRDEPESALAPEAMARLALLDERMHRPARARRVAQKLAQVAEDATVFGADGQPKKLARTLAAEVLGRTERAEPDAIMAKDAVRDVAPPLRRVFRSTTELSAQEAKPIEPRNRSQEPEGRFLLERGHSIEQRSTTTGVTLVTFDLPGALIVSRRWPGYCGGSLVVPSPEGLAAYDALTGAVRWKTGALQPSNPARETISPDDLNAVEYGDSIVLAHTKWNELIAFDAAKGTVLWTRALDKKTPSSGGILARGDQGFVVGDNPGRIEALELATGKTLWTWKPDAAPGVIARLTLARFAGQDGVAAVIDGKRLALVDRSTGGTRFYASAGEGWFGEVMPSPDGLSLVVRSSGAGETRLWVFDARTGKERWHDDGLGAVMPGRRESGAVPRLDEVIPGETAVYTFRVRSSTTEVWAQDMVAGTLLWAWEATRGLTGPNTIVETPTSLIVGRDGGLDRPTLVVLGKGTGQPEQVSNGAVGDPLLLPGRKLVGRGIMAASGVVIATTDRGTCGLANVDDEALARETIEDALALEKEDSAERRAALANDLAKANPPRLDDAIGTCARALESEGLANERYDRVFSQLAALSEMSVESRQPGYEIRRMTRPPEIDGELNDWWRGWSGIDLTGPRYVQPIQIEGGRPGRWHGPEDLSAKLYMGWDDKYFYFALDVMDTDLRPYDSESDRWIGDCLLIAIDCKDNGGFRFMPDDMLLSLALTLPKKKKDDKEQQKKDEEEEANKPEGKYFVKRKDDGSGAVYEAQIPWALYVKNGVTAFDPARGPQPGFRFGFNIVLIDDDGDRFSTADLPPGAKGDGSDGLPKEGDFRGALKTLQLTPSVLLHERKDRLWQGYIPEYFAKITLK